MTVTTPQVRVGEPLRHKALTVFPLFTPSGGQVDYRLSEEVIADESLLVREVSEAGSVSVLSVENKGDLRVLLIEGEELIGAKQNRILNTSLLVAAQGTAKVPVSCVEQHRWGYKSRHFRSSGHHATYKVRSELKSSVARSLRARQGHRSDQMRLWESVASLQAACFVASPTSAMSDAFDQCAGHVEEYVTRLSDIEGSSGAAVAIGSRIVSVDLFDKPSTFHKVWKRCLPGFALDSINIPATEQTPDTACLQRLLDTAAAAAWRRVETVGEGEEYRAEFDGFQASVLRLGDAIIHESVLAC